MKRGNLALALVPLLVMGTACSRAPDQAAAGQTVESPAAPGSAEPNLAVGADGRLYFSWIEPHGDDASALRFSAWEGEAWSAPRTIATGDDWFVNWADFPSMAALADGTLAAHWLAKSGSGTYSYDVMLSLSWDGGDTWSEPVRPHSDGTQSEHGFVSLIPWGDRFALFWLDGRQTVAAERGPMTLRHGTVDREGNVGPDVLVDGSVCDCCQTDAVRLADDSLLVAYRGRSSAEIRDIYVSRLEGEGWSEPAAVFEDNWETTQCPVNGPAIASRGDRLVAAWFTRSEPRQGHVRVAFSGDGGRTFDEPIEVDDGEPDGRVDLSLLEDGSALVAWLELGDTPSIRVRRVSPDGATGEAVVATTTSGARASGFPRMARFDGRTFLAWTEPGDPSHVRMAVLR